MARLNEPPVAPAAPSSTATGVVTAAGGTESIEVCEYTPLSYNLATEDAEMRTKSKPAKEKPPADFDEVKRRFIRQNRELAKNNSSQSLRIRNLELEVSKLLSDNLDLREQVLGLQHELHNARRQATSEAMVRMKCDLRAKIAELSGLVDDIDDIQEAEPVLPSLDKSRVLSPGQRQYRERQPLADLMQDAVMPTISENKLYPRRTLDAEEIRAIRLSGNSTSTGSPDLGPPPVAHFDTEAPIKFNSSQESEPPASPMSPKVEEELLPSVNLETRRRRKDSSSRIEIRRHSILAQSPEKAENEAATTILRTGAKRKLADRDTEKPIKPPSTDDFTFSRKISLGQPEPESVPIKLEEPALEPVEASVSKSAPETNKPVRKVLGDKSTNMSPKKASARTGKPLKDDLQKPPPKLAATKDRPPSRGRRVSSIPQPAAQDEVLPTLDIPPPEPLLPEQLQPETPATHDIFSPATSQPSTLVKAEARDTPPPSDLSSISNTTEGGIRPSRRARSAVNYAEPSLTAKMRRPDGKMVDAISGIQDPRRVIVPSKERRSVGSTSVPRTVVIKNEPEDEESGWRSTSQPVEASPLKEKSTDEHPPTTIDDSVAPSTKPSSSAATLSSVIATSRKRREQMERRDSQPFGPDQDAAAAKKEEMDLYEFKDSSSPATDTSSRAPSPKAASRRRHSTMPKEAPSVSTSAPARTDRVASRRRSMMI